MDPKFVIFTGPMFGTLESDYAFTIDGKYIIYSNVDTGKVTITYKPSKDFNGADEFPYVVNDRRPVKARTACRSFCWRDDLWKPASDASASQSATLIHIPQTSAA